MDPLVIAQIAVAGAQDILFALAVGALACGWMLTRQGVLPPDGLARWRIGTLSVLVLACCLYLWLQAAVMGGTSFTEAGSAVAAVLTQSHFGIAWTVGLSGVVIALLGGARNIPTAWLIATAGAIVYAAGKAAASHAADAGDFTLREAVHVVHLCATALWAGSVIVAACLLHLRALWSSAPPERRAAFCAQLSHVATVALGVVIVTGIYNATQDTAHLSVPLFSVLYGQVLTLKLVLVTSTVLLGGYNRMIYLPRLESAVTGDAAAFHHAQRGFDRLLAVEAVAMIVVLTVAAVLGHTSPSAG